MTKSGAIVPDVQLYITTDNRDVAGVDSIHSVGDHNWFNELNIPRIKLCNLLPKASLPHPLYVNYRSIWAVKDAKRLVIH